MEIPDNEIAFHAVRSSGKGGQNVNKVSTKVELIFTLPTSSIINERARARLRTQAKRFLDSDGNLRITCQESRSQIKNKKLALDKLKELIATAMIEPKKRTATKPGKGAIATARKAKEKSSEKKSSRKKIDPGAE